MCARAIISKARRAAYAEGQAGVQRTGPVLQAFPGWLRASNLSPCEAYVFPRGWLFSCRCKACGGFGEKWGGMLLPEKYPYLIRYSICASRPGEGSDT